VDYVFLYRSVAMQHGLKWLALPDEINLKNMALADHYATVSVEISGKTPDTTMTQRGEPMVYGVTIPRNAPNPGAALAFVAFMLEENGGLAFMERNGQPPIAPAPTDTFDKIPESLRPFALRAKVPDRRKARW